jgi:cell division protease FtsH
MVTKYGMSDKLGPMMFGTENNEVFLGKDFGRTRDYSEEVAAKIDREISGIIDNAYNICIDLLTENMEKLHEVAKVLLEKEKIEADEFMEIFPYEKEEVEFEDISKTVEKIEESIAEPKEEIKEETENN